jgi:hypothetical protein
MGDRPYCAAHNNGGATFDVYLQDCPCNKPTPDPVDITDQAIALMLASKHGGPPEVLDAIRGLVAKLDAGGEAAVRAIVATRDARIAELEAALAGLVDALPRCRGHVIDTVAERLPEHDAIAVEEVADYRREANVCAECAAKVRAMTHDFRPEALGRLPNADAIEVAERALGRRK